MVEVNVKAQTELLVANFKQLDEKQIKLAINNAINRSLMKGRTVARMKVKEEYNIPQRYVNRIEKKNSRPSTLTGFIVASSIPLPMDAFNPQFQTSTSVLSITRRGEQKEKARKKGKVSAGVTIEVHKGSKETIPFAFMIKGAKPRVFARGEYRTGGSYGFVQRHTRENKSGSDLPIKPLLSVTVHAAVINDEVESKIAKEIEVYYPQRLQVELKYQLDKMKGII